jgi:predicted tellurium resistance membrane protein TerC
MSEMLAEIMTAEALAAFATLAALEIVLGIDNLMFVQIVASRCKPELQDSARRTGLAHPPRPAVLDLVDRRAGGADCQLLGL